MDFPELPALVETKTTLAGQQKVFRCRVLEMHARAAVVLFVSEVPMHVAGLTLPPGTVTFGYFWEDRPYNVYHWMTSHGETLGYYCNVSDETRIQPGTITWRDLTVDVLFRADGAVEVLDEDELPADLPQALRSQITAATTMLVAAAGQLRTELESRSLGLRARLSRGPR